MLDIMADTDLSHTHNDSADTPDLSRMSCGCNSPERLRSGLPDASSGWAVVQTHAQAERWAEANIRRIGYPTFLPLCAASVRDRLVRSLHHTVLRPLFPTYLFVNVAGAPIVPVWYAPGVNHMLMNGEKPHMVPGAVFSALQAGEASRRTPTPPETFPRPGDPATMLVEPFLGLDAVVVAVRRKTVRVVTFMLGAMREIVVSRTSIAPRAH
jgi:transcription antitermination factor NusG